MLKARLSELFPGINIVGAVSPPFRDLTEEEYAGFVQEINDAAFDILFVSFGTPKQERWMAGHKGRIKVVQLGVGAAFDFIIGETRQAPVDAEGAP